MFDAQVWGLDRQATFGERQSQLISAAAAAPAAKRLQQRLDLARFYLLARCIRRPRACLTWCSPEDTPASEDVTGSVLRADRQA